MTVRRHLRHNGCVYRGYCVTAQLSYQIFICVTICVSCVQIHKWHVSDCLCHNTTARTAWLYSCVYHSKLSHVYNDAVYVIPQMSVCVSRYIWHNTNVTAQLFSSHITACVGKLCVRGSACNHGAIQCQSSV